MTKKYTLLLFAITLIFSLLAGCSEEEDHELKLAVTDAISKQSEITSYQFSGSANLQLDWAALTESSYDPLTSTFISLITNGLTVWTGNADTQTAQMELDLTVSPHQSGASFKLPAMVKDNKLYFNIPLLTTSEEEYLYIDVDGDLTSLPFSSILMHLAEAIDEQYYEEINKDDETTKTIVIHITQENAIELLHALQSQFPMIITELENSNLLSSEQASIWRKKSEAEIEDILSVTDIDETGLVSFTINQDGYIVEQTIKLYYQNQSLEIHNRMDEINQSPSFEKEIPEQIRSLDEIIKMLNIAQ